MIRLAVSFASIVGLLGCSGSGTETTRERFDARPPADVGAGDAPGQDAANDEGQCPTSEDLCAACLADRCCSALQACAADAQCAGAWSDLLECREAGGPGDECWGHKFLGQASGEAGAPVTDCMFANCSSACLQGA